MAEPKADPKSPSSSEKDVKAEPKSPHHHQETHGRSDDIDEDTPIDEVKGPGVFGRIKEEIEALVGAIRSKKDKSDQSSS